MANTLLTPTAVTREALRVLHQKLNFIGSINREYDSSFAKTGAKIGDSLKIRLPNQYTVQTGAAYSGEDVTESSVTLQVATQKHVDLSFTSDDLTMDLDDFSSRIIEPAMSVLAASVEADAYSMYKDVYNIVDNDASVITFKNIMEGRKVLNDELAPHSGRTAMLSTSHEVDLVDALKGLFHDSKSVSKQYREGSMGRTGGFDFYENTHVSDHATGTAAKTTGYLTNGATQVGSSIIVDTGTTTFVKGDVITFAGVNRVHGETKVDSGSLQQFVITTDYAGGAGTITVSPEAVATGSKQNVSNTIADGSALVKIGAGASESVNSSMVYCKDAFAFATADLVMPKGVDFAAREVQDGISLRVIRDYDIDTDSIKTRVDILYGFKAIRPALAARIHADG